MARDDTEAWIRTLLGKAGRDAAGLEREGWGDPGRILSMTPMTAPRRPSLPPLLAFVSFSMPTASLEALLDQVRKAGGTLVLRGLVNDSFRDTAAAIAPFADKGGFSVDPKLFERFGITVVPTFVVAPDAHDPDAVSGNMTLGAALEAVAAEGDHPGVARALLAKLRETGP